MLVDVIFREDCLEANVRCAVEDCKVVIPMGSEMYDEKNIEKAKELAIQRFYQMANEYYTKGFDRDEVFQVENVVELRNGNKYEIREYKPFKDGTTWLMAYKVSGAEIEDELIYALWDEFCFYGVNTTMDVVKVFDSEGNLKAERTQYNMLSTKNFYKE